ncbi:MAG: aminotransferase class V-fold PLP-dependent enzyme [Gemmatimonadota bacterium]|nr:MAG: aminotransferase class V-fold PLP-dependent enzyme [Gemmatimonadota bacterium]
MNLDDVRQSFPGLADKVFLDAAAVSLTPVEARAGIEEFLDLAVSGDAGDASRLHLAMDNMRYEALEEAAKLLNTRTENVALIESTTHGLNIAANALPLRRGENVLIADTEYLQVAIPWAKKRESIGLELKPVHSHGEGVLTPDDFAAAIDSKTKAVCVSSVQWCSGFRMAIRQLGEICRGQEIWLVVDAVQEMGAMEIDLASQYADFVIAGGHKWLNAPFGCGVMFVSDRVLAELEPVSHGYMALEPPEGGWGVYFQTPDITPYRDYVFPLTAKKFEIAGTSNYPGTVGLGKSLKLVNEIGIRNVEQHIRRLTDLLHEELEQAGARLISHRDPAYRSGITVFRRHTDPANDLTLLNRILGDRIVISIRYTSNIGGLRVSSHYYNTDDDIKQLCDAVRRHSSH